MHEGHRDRMKQRFLSEGLDNFDSHNTLELLLFYSIPRRDTNEVAHRLINEFGSLSGVLDASYEDLMKCGGIGESSATLIKLIPALSRKYLDDKTGRGGLITSTSDAKKFLIPKFFGETREKLVIVCLDNKGFIMHFSVLSKGIANATEINNRQILELALRHNATSVLISHNHPNGLPSPSKADVTSTIRLTDILMSVGIKLLDHIIVANRDSYSMADHGIIGPY